MLSWFRTHRRSALICGATLLLPLLLYIGLLADAWALRSEYQADIDRLLPRIARMEGIKAYEGELSASAAGVREVIESLVYPVTTDRGEVSAALQKDVWQLMGDAGLSVSNSQVLPLREGEKFDYIGLKLTVSGDVTALDESLSALAAFTPLVIVESLDVWPNRQRSSEPVQQQVTASLKLVSLRAVL
jgi:general secretion pathway protein M